MIDSPYTRRIINFGSGPAALPPEVLQQASEAVIDYNDSGLSILEIPHRGSLMNSILEEASQLVKELCGLDDDYSVLWLQGGGRLQFSMLPMNFLHEHKHAGYIDSGHWSSEAISYANYYGQTSIIASSKPENYRSLPALPPSLPPELAYLHLTSNNTIYGTQWAELPTTSAPLIVDMSSDILSRARHYNRCSLFYAVAQKNIGPAGVTLVVLNNDFAKTARKDLPPFLSYSAQIKNNSVVNTPPVFAIYTSLLMLRWTKEISLHVLEEESIRKASMLYSELERNSFFEPVVKEQNHRSRMNVCFTANKINGIEQRFLDFCSQNGIVGIDGHRSVGGFRASLYNAIRVQDVERLVVVMQEFEHQENKTR